MKLNLGCGMWGTVLNPWPPEAPANFDFGAPLPAWVNVDYHRPPNLSPGVVFVEHDLNALPWPFPDNTFDEIRAYHILEHLTDVVTVMREIRRVAINGAKVDIVVPYAGTLNDISNPQHRHHFHHRTFEWFCQNAGDTNDLDFAERGFVMISQHLREKGQEDFQGITWRIANLQTVLQVVK